MLAQTNEAQTIMNNPNDRNDVNIFFSEDCQGWIVEILAIGDEWIRLGVYLNFIDAAAAANKVI